MDWNGSVRTGWLVGRAGASLLGDCAVYDTVVGDKKPLANPQPSRGFLFVIAIGLTTVMLFAIIRELLNNNGELNTMAKTIKTTKADAKPAKTTKPNINWRKLVKKFVARPLAYVTVLVLASYGMKQMLHTLDDRAAVVLTTLAVLGLVYIMFDES